MPFLVDFIGLHLHQFAPGRGTSQLEIPAASLHPPAPLPVMLPAYQQRYLHHSSVIVNPLPPSPPLETRGLPPQPKEEVGPPQPDEEPIYQEIKPKSEKEEVADTTAEEAERVVRKKAEAGRRKKSKEVEYWQITAKEIVKFRPCTETFINRS